MRYKIYTKTEKAWDTMFQAISRAKSSIFFEMYIFADDTSDTHDFI
jgi:phosphatidylserine/phosphatidylglycerophosphate/cardiolipin synthase-like enzyme